MKKLLFLFALLICIKSSGQSVETATVTITNAVGVTNGQTITVNGVVRTWTNNVFNSANQIQATNTFILAASNLFLSYATVPAPQIIISRGNSSNVVFQSYPGFSSVVSLSVGYGTVSFSTNYITNAVAVRVPYTTEGNLQRTNIASGLVAWLSLDKTTNSFTETNKAFVNFVGLTNGQVVSGLKVFLGNNLYSNGFYINPTMTNGINYSNSFSSPGISSFSEQFGAGAVTVGGHTTALGADSHAEGTAATAIGYQANSVGNGSLSLGGTAQATNANAIAIGGASLAGSVYGTAIGGATYVAPDHQNSTALGFGATTTASNQVMLGSAGISVVVNNQLDVAGGANIAGAITNAIFSGKTTFNQQSDVSFSRFPITSLANGNNAGIIVGTNVFISVSGPSAAFTINGMANGRDGKYLIVVNQTGFDMTIANQSGTDPVAANRIITNTGADRTTTGNGSATFIYDGSQSRWVILNFDP